MRFKALLFIGLPLFLAQPSWAVKPLERVQTQFIEGVLSDVLIKDSLASTLHLKTLKQQLNHFKQQPTLAQLSRIQTEFKSLLQTWKSVETVYVAGAIDEDYIDHPRFIDFFHQSNESIPKLIDHALKNKAPLNKVLFKYSTKSINALEVLLFAKTKDELIELLQQRNFRRINAALIVVNNMQLWLGEIAEFYQTDQKLKANPGHALGLVVNALIDSSYKLVNWRIGEAGGLAKKHFGKPSIKHLEYALSQSSLLAVKAILTTQRKIVDREGERDLLAISQVKNVSSELLSIRKQLDKALHLVDTLPLPLADNLKSEDYKTLHKTLEQLHNAYYFLLIDALGLSANIIDADGD